MTTPDLHHHRALVHKILTQSQRLLMRDAVSARSALASVLNTATEHVCNKHATRVSPHHAAWLEAEAASHLINAAGWQLTGLTDPTLPHYLTRLDQRPYPARLRLLDTAAHRANPDCPITPPTFSLPQQRTSAPTASRRRVGRCPCVCNSGGSCGGCGHAGCGGR
ncbi:hypothetical protein DNK48_35915 [Streptomyces malaysiensis subsp. malaysiensis]|uniref:hypothetical protein n=1 Tax=Streptomyces malaysiensis TaxID=92644 RepID=UPI000BFD83DC|nr:hypothetical protein [Streptomyces malaysiensis]ATL81737.1 hypothetical protein SMALA_1503 [Streptomyces malaysiensis]QDL73847.1 hypothetical protein DNK48_35915 [Streptomyces malaysiensis]